MFGLDCYQGHMSVNYKHMIYVGPAFSDTMSEDKEEENNRVQE